MVNINRKIEDALSSLVDNNIWPLSKPGEARIDNYIVYRPETEKPASFDAFFANIVHFFAIMVQLDILLV